MIRVLTIAGGGNGQGYDLTDDIEGLSFSNVDPGGDESASFTYKRPWSNTLPEIAKGNLLVIEDGLDVLWQGRIGEPARGGDASEFVAVTGYGLGIRLKDGQLDRIYVDQDLGHWRAMSRTRRINLLTLGRDSIQDFAVEPDLATGSPSLRMRLDGPWAVGAYSEAYYDAGEMARIGRVDYDWTAEGAGVNFVGRLSGADDDVPAGTVTGTDVLDGSTSGSQSETIASQRVAFFSFNRNAAETGETDRSWTVTGIYVYGDHDLTPQAGGGYYASDVIPDVIADVDGISVRTNDATDFEIGQLVSSGPHEDLISAIHAFHKHERTWGTWGTDDALEQVGDGKFDWAARPSEPEWFAYRSQCEDLDLSSEIDNLFDTVIVSYSDSAGKARQVVRTLPSADLEAAGMSGRTARVSAGTLYPGAAAALGDAMLAYNGGYAPARGSLTIAQPLKHSTRGTLPPHYLRADGAMIRVPDILPSRTLFALDDSVDRRTTFPIKRVRVDLSGAYPRATVDIDQSNDLISTAEARLGLAAETTLG